MASKKVEDIYPLSPMQRGMMFQTLNNPESPVYLEQIRLTLDGLDAAVFRRSWERMFERFPPLRTSIVGTGRQEPVQVVRRSVELPWQTHDVREETPADHATWIDAFLREDLARGFDLGASSLHRLTLVRTGERQYELIWTLHHVVLDGWSGAIVLKDLLRCYEALVAGVEPELPDRRPFREYIQWLRDRDPERSEPYWRERLAGFRVPTRLEADRNPRGNAVDITRYGREELTLSAAATGVTRDSAARCRVTLNTMTTAAWSLLLTRYAGEDDIVFGRVVSGRPDDLAGVDTMAGMFVNTLPLRTSVPPDQPLRVWLADLQMQQAEQQAHEHSPLWEIQRWSDLPAGTPLFEALFVFENYPGIGVDAPRASGLRVRVTPPFDRTAYPLMLLVMPGESMRFSITFDADRYEPATIRRILGHLERVLEQMATGIDRPASALTLIDSAEREQVVVEWNRTERAFPPDRGLHQLVEARAAQTPDAPAVTHGDDRLTYRELDEHANRLAHELRARGVVPDAPVGLCVERSVDTIVGVLGILKAGGGYVPLDPAYPADRLRYMLESAATSVVVAHAATSDRVTQLAGTASGTRIIDLDRDAATLAAQPTGAPAVPVDPDHLAYILFTSGSTGRPKGVAMPHAPLVNLMHWQLEMSAVGAGARTLQFAPVSFDVSCQEIFATLAAGGELYLIDEDRRRDSEALLDFLIEHDIARIFVPFVALQHLAETAVHRERWPTALREVITAGEQLQVTPALATLFERRPEARLVNQYGPTECHVVSSFTLAGPPRDWPALPPIGRPIANTRLFVLDRQRQPVPIGVPGELYIGGRAVARGYVGDPALTAGRFVEDPFDPSSSARLYRTGDLVRARADGEIDFLGRVDQQVKLRGFRVEPGEVEAIVTAHPDVVQAAAVVREDRPGDRRLVAYVTTGADPAPTSSALRAFALDRLPEHMVPAAFVPLSALPLTPTGKIDRLALLVAEHAPLETRVTYVAPRGPVEETLAELWSEVLGVRNPGVHDDFFELGGHSLKATQLVSRMRDALETELPLRSLFEHPTIAGLAETLAHANHVDVPALTAMGHDGRAPLSYAQQRLWFLDQMGTGTAYSMPWAFRLEGALDAAALAGSLNAIVRRHEVLRTRFPSIQGRPVQEILPTLELPLRRVDLTSLPPAEREPEARRLHQIEALAPFDLAEGPLLRPTLVRLDENVHVLFLSIHHIVFDGWSIGVLNRELEAEYRARTSGTTAEIEASRVQYADFARWQRGWMEGPVLERQLAYWREQLDGVPNLDLPVDRPRPAHQTYRGASHFMRIPDEVIRGLRTLGRRRGATLAMTLLASFKVLLARTSGQTDIAVGSPIANRTHRELEDLVGFFVNTLVQRTDLAGDPTFTELLDRVKATALAAYEHQDIPFERIVDELQPERDQSRNPLFQVAFAMLNMPGAPLALPGLEVASFDGQSRATRFDVELYISDTPTGVKGGFCYNVDLFDASTIARMAEHLQLLLESIVANPDAKLTELSMLPAADRVRILEQWNDTATETPGAPLVHELFADHAARSRDATALIHDDTVVTYGALDERSSQLAHMLRQMGVETGHVVGLCLERSPEMVVGLLGILKAGAAYMPLDPAYPTQRLAFMLEDNDVSVLLTRDSSLENLPDGRFEILDLDRDAPKIRRAPSTVPSPSVSTHDLVYVIYTSGSSGRPKGVGVTHGGLANYLRWCREAYGLSAGDTTIVHSPLTFDLTVTSLLAPLAAGMAVRLAPEELEVDSLAAAIRAEDTVDLIKITPVHLRLLADQLTAEERRRVRTFVIGGESLTSEHVSPWISTDGGPTLINEYGPTETVVGVCVHRLPHAEAPEGSIPIGRPIDNTRIYLLDPNLTPVPIGVPGEAYIGGVQVARGYVQRPDLTAERFVPDPFASEAGARLYRTGDLAHYRPDGTIEFMGRVDEQVKLRGYRIEPGEIEAALDAHPWVGSSVVSLREETDGDRRLVGYVVRADDAVIQDEGELVDQWQSLYEDTYRHGTEDSDPTFNIVGWNSSYTEQPIPAPEMREWVDETVGRLRRGDPRRVLEIGCGSGLLLFRVAPHCDEYVGTDFSSGALEYIRRHLPGVDGLRDGVVDLRQCKADALGSIEPGRYDLVVVNSVVQYFPSIGYLLRVLEGAVAAVADGGRVFIGDVRNLLLLEAYHASVQLYRAADDERVADLGKHVRQRLAQEEELVIDPAFFATLPHHLPRITHVEIEPKYAKAHNELTKFRYEVTLHVGTEAPAETGDWVDWSDGHPTLATIANELRRSPHLSVRGVPNARTLADVTAASLLESGDAGETVGELREDVAERINGAGLDPGDLIALERNFPVRTTLSWVRSSPAGDFDLSIVPADATIPACFPIPKARPRPWSSYANHPLQAKMTRQLAPKLRASLEHTLPPYMVPSAFVMLESLPLTAHGKIDRRALPEPEWYLSQRRGAYVAPKNPVEKKLAGIWAQLLGVDRVGRLDNFFELGGHSLVATQVVSRIHDAFDVEVELHQLFDTPTVGELAELVEGLQWAHQGSAAVVGVADDDREGGEL